MKQYFFAQKSVILGATFLVLVCAIFFRKSIYRTMSSFAVDSLEEDIQFLSGIAPVICEMDQLSSIGREAGRHAKNLNISAVKQDIEASALCVQRIHRLSTQIKAFDTSSKALKSTLVSETTYMYDLAQDWRDYDSKQNIEIVNDIVLLKAAYHTYQLAVRWQNIEPNIRAAQKKYESQLRDRLQVVQTESWLVWMLPNSERMLVVDELENAIIEKASKNKDFKKYELSLKPYIARLKQNLVHTAGQQKPQWAKIIEANDDAPVKMRSKPKKSATLIASIPIDATVKILETTETHAKVTYEENTGWILKQVGGKPLYALTSSSSMAFAGTNITLFGVILLFGMLIWYYRNSVQYWWKQLA